MRQLQINEEQAQFEVLPNYDEDRVYASDIKKVLQWYNLLQENGKLNNEESEATEVSTEEEQQA